MISGSIVAIVTPLDPSGGLDLDAMSRIVEWHIQEGTDAIVAVGTTGESATLRVSEHCEVIKHVVEQVANRLPVIAGTGANSTFEAIELTKAAKEIGADACLLVTPYYNRPSQEGLYQHFKLIAESVDIPQILYNVPSRTACDLLPATVKRLASIENIVGIKEATGDVDRANEVMELCGDQIALYSGDDAIAMELMFAGAKGNISVTANVAPRAMHELCELAISGKVEQAKVMNDTVAALHKNLFLEANPVPVKWAMKQMGLISPGIRLPLVELNQKFHDQVRQAMLKAGLI